MLETEQGGSGLAGREMSPVEEEMRMRSEPVHDLLDVDGGHVGGMEGLVVGGHNRVEDAAKVREGHALGD